MPAYNLPSFSTLVAAIGKGAVFYGDAFAGSGNDLSLTALGFIEGELSIELNDSYSTLVLPENTGPAPIEKYLEGYAPEVTIPLIAADSALRAIVSPTGSAHGGYTRRRAVTEHSLVIFPEQLFIESNADAEVEYTQEGGWTVGGDAATPAQLALLDLSVWFWRGHFTATPPMYRHEDGGKVVQNVIFHSMHNSAMPEGHHLFTIGRPDQVSPAIQIAAPAES